MSSTEFRQRLAAILAADAAGYSSSMAADDRATVASLDAARAVFRTRIESNQGRVIDMAGDSVLAVFDLASDAVSAALAIQQALDAAAGASPAGASLRFRIGVHLGEIIEKLDGTVYGDGVNIAARLQALADPGEIAVSDAVKGAVGRRVPATFADRGERAIKNIPEAIRWHSAISMQPDSREAVPRARNALTRTAEDVATLPSIAILPFRTSTTEPEQAAFADGLRIDIQGALVRLAGLVLIGVGTTNTYRNKEVPPRQAAAEMGVRYLLEGFVQKSGERVRITASLIDGAAGQVIWSDRYDRVLDDALEVQDEITEKVVTALDVKMVSGEHARVWRKAIRNPRAREHFYRGMHEFMKGNKDANTAARGEYEQVARLAPAIAAGPTNVAFTHWWDVFRGWTASPAQSWGEAERWAARAMPMEDTDGQAHTVMAHLHLLRREHDLALKVAQQAVTLRPSCSNANPHLGNILYYCGKPAEAADRIRQAMRMMPVHAPWFNVLLAASCKELRQWGAAEAAAREALRKKPDDVDARLVLIEVLQTTGEEDAARELVREVATLQPEFSLARWAETQPYRDGATLDRITANLRAAGLAP